MARLIDADKFSERILRFAKRLEDLGMPDRAKAVRAVAKGIKLEKTVDAVEVVRCKDCKDHDRCEVEDLLVKFQCIENAYCAAGERRTDG